MVRTPSGRKHLHPLPGGPWLVTRVFWLSVGMTLTGLVLVFGSYFVCAVLLQQRRNDVGFFLMIVGAMLTVSGPALGLLQWLGSLATQICPDCLRSMDRGAYVCPYCGFRETPRQEHS